MKRSLAKQRGFSLLELMAVVMLIAIIASVSIAVFNSGGEKKSFHAAIEQFVEYSHQVSDLSILTGEPVGLVLTPPDWAEDPLETPGWTYTWRRYVELETETPSADAEAEEVDDASAAIDEQAALQQYFQQQNSQAQWMQIEGVDAIQVPEEVQLFVNVEGTQWDWNATPKHENPIFVLYPTGEAEPFLFEIEFAHIDPELDEQTVELGQSGRLQWVEAREAHLALKESLQ